MERENKGEEEIGMSDKGTNMERQRREEGREATKMGTVCQSSSFSPVCKEPHIRPGDSEPLNDPGKLRL